MSREEISERIQRSIAAQASGEETFEQGLLLRWVDRMAQQDEYKHLDEQFFLIARALVLYDFQPKKFLDICVRQGNNVKFMDAVKPEKVPEVDGTFSKTITFNGVDYVVKHFKGIDKTDIYREIAVQNALYLMMPQHVPLIRGWNSEYIFMNKVSGETLEKYFQSTKKLTKNHLVSIIDIFTHLAFLGITQGDVLGQNMLIRSDTSEVVIIDLRYSVDQHVDTHRDLLSVFKSFVSSSELSVSETEQIGVIVGGVTTTSVIELLPVLLQIRTLLTGTTTNSTTTDSTASAATTTSATTALDTTTVPTANETDLISMFGALK